MQRTQGSQATNSTHLELKYCIPAYLELIFQIKRTLTKSYVKTTTHIYPVTQKVEVWSLKPFHKTATAAVLDFHSPQHNPQLNICRFRGIFQSLIFSSKHANAWLKYTVSYLFTRDFQSVVKNGLIQLNSLNHTINN